MHAIIRKGNKEYYISVVLGFYRINPKADKYYFVVLNEDKNKLIKCDQYFPGNILSPRLLIVDNDTSNWNKDENGIGEVNLFNKDELDTYCEKDEIPQEILNRILHLDNKYKYKEYNEINNKKDIDNLMWATGYFHDARITKQEMIYSNTLYLKFDGIWGCEVEMWLSESLNYDTSSRNPEEFDPYWYGATMILKNDYIYFIDEDDMKSVEDLKGYCWFKCKKIKYHIIPE